jgi:hypothetical protein
MIRGHPEGAVVDVWVVPGSSRDVVGGFHDGALRVRTTAPPSGGAANRAVAHLVARAAGGKAGEVIAGHGARRKQVLVRGITPDQASDRLAGNAGASS